MSKFRKTNWKQYLPILIVGGFLSYIMFSGLSIVGKKDTKLHFTNISNNSDYLLTNNQQPATNNPTTKIKLTYDEFKNWVAKEKKNLPLDSAKIFLNKIYQTHIPYYWNGTDWDFNGTTQIPQKGNIACGYFVTNTLYDIGFPVRRIYHAQQPSSKMINDLGVNVKRFDAVEKVKNHIFNDYNSDQVFIIGLDFHTGFLLKEGNEIFFLHSNYITDTVEKEMMEESANFNSSNSFMLSSLTENDKKIREWQNN